MGQSSRVLPSCMYRLVGGGGGGTKFPIDEVGRAGPGRSVMC